MYFQGSIVAALACVLLVVIVVTRAWTWRPRIQVQLGGLLVLVGLLVATSVAVWMVAS